MRFEGKGETSIFLSDLTRDTAWRCCSGGARGLWVTVLDMMLASERPGLLLVGGKPATTAQVARVAGLDVTDVEGWMAELMACGVASCVDGLTADKRKRVESAYGAVPDGTIFNRRRVREVVRLHGKGDAEQSLSDKRRAAAMARWGGGVKGEGGRVKGEGGRGKGEGGGVKGVAENDAKPTLRRERQQGRTEEGEALRGVRGVLRAWNGGGAVSFAECRPFVKWWDKVGAMEFAERAEQVWLKYDRMVRPSDFAGWKASRGKRAERSESRWQDEAQDDGKGGGRNGIRRNGRSLKGATAEEVRTVTEQWLERAGAARNGNGVNREVVVDGVAGMAVKG